MYSFGSVVDHSPARYSSRCGPAIRTCFPPANSTSYYMRYRGFDRGLYGPRMPFRQPLPRILTLILSVSGRSPDYRLNHFGIHVRVTATLVVNHHARRNDLTPCLSICSPKVATDVLVRYGMEYGP